jgi:hypothetical protein
MGDRVNIAVQDEGKRVYFYGHWSGQDAPTLVQSALKRGKDRWDDPAYLARVVFDDFTGGDRDTTGYGISTEPGDNEHPFIIVDCDKQTVYAESDPREHYSHCAITGDAPQISFADYTNGEVDWGTLDTGLKDEDAA